MASRWTEIRRKLPFLNILEYALLRAFAGLLNILPMEISDAIARATGRLIYRLQGKRRKTALENVRRAYGGIKSPEEERAIAVKSFEHVAVGLMEFFRAPKTVKEAERRFVMEGREHAEKALARGKGIITPIAHLGAWEYQGFIGCIKPIMPCSVVARSVRNPYITGWIQRLRASCGLRHIDKDSAIRQVMRDLRDNFVVGILIDQWAGNDGLWVEFFGEKTSTTSVPARLAKKTGAALVPMSCLRLGPGRYKIVFYPEVPVSSGEKWEEETTLALNRHLEALILSYPEQWSWGHRRWKPGAIMNKSS